MLLFLLLLAFTVAVVVERGVCVYIYIYIKAKTNRIWIMADFAVNCNVLGIVAIFYLLL